MEAISHIFLVFFYCLSGSIFIIYLLFRYAIANRLNTVRDSIRDLAERARTVIRIHKTVDRINDALTTKEKLHAGPIMDATRKKAGDVNEYIRQHISEVEHRVSALEYKCRTGPHIAWPPWAKRKLRNIIKEMQELRALVEQATQY